jgi:hypothetical protein
MQDFIDTPGSGIKHELVEHLQQQLAHAAKRVDFVLAFTRPRQVVMGFVQAVEQRLHQLCLVVEVPVDRPPRHTRQFGDVGQRGSRNPALVEGLFRRLDDLGAGFLGFFFGSTDHGSTTSSGPNARRVRGTLRGHLCREPRG